MDKSRKALFCENRTIPGNKVKTATGLRHAAPELRERVLVRRAHEQRRDLSPEPRRASRLPCSATHPY